MKSRAKAVVIGGGVVGVGTLYHLAKKGWDDVVLIERKELTSGSTWHAAGLLPLFNLSYSVGQIHKYSVKLYGELEEETGQPVGFSRVSNIRLAMTQDRWDEYQYYAGIAETLGVRVNQLTPAQLKEIWPLANTDGLLGAIQHPDDGYIQPADLTQALARGARNRGAEIYRNTTVTAVERLGDEWVVLTDKGDIACTHVVCASGNFARKTGALLGLDIPVIPVEHQYIVTEPHPDIVARHKAGQPEMGVLRESDNSWYLREEAGGLILGPYEKGAPCCYVDGPSEQSEYELFQEDLERLGPHIESAISRVPAFGEVGIKKVYNGAIAYTPDGSPIVGPAWDLPNVWLNEGHSFGVTAAGGAGWQLAEWIVDGEPTIDMMGVDPRRFGPYATEGYLRVKNEEAYANVFTTHYPDEERAAGRPLKTTPVYERLKQHGAVFGSSYGWERVNWFAPLDYVLPENERGVGADVLTAHNHASADYTGNVREKWSFRRSNYFDFVGEEVKAVHNGVGILDMSGFAKCEISGPGARAWLESLFANALPKKQGRVGLAHVLTSRGGVLSEFTVFERSPGVFYLVSGGALERHDHDTLRKLMPGDGSVSMRAMTAERGVLVLAGPRSRDVLQKLTRADLSSSAFPWLSGQTISVGTATADALRVNFVGELGWELHHPIEQQGALFDQIMEAGRAFNITPFGMRAMDSMRLEKSYRAIPRELSIEYSAFESGLDRFVKLDKGAFRGREGLQAAETQGRKWQFVTLEVGDIVDADARGNEAIYANGRLVGRATSGGFGWRTGTSLALAMVPPSLAKVGQAFEIKILGRMYPATVIPESPFDPDNARLRA
ncbi:MAG: FAD-dependent oxidoreductase [Pseudomonadota bacterium]